MDFYATHLASMAATPGALPLQEKIQISNTQQRARDLIILFLLLSLLFYRLVSLSSHGPLWLTALFCESWFTFIWTLYVSSKWNPVKYQTYPQRLLQRFDDLPAVDVFVTTADATLEPPIVTVNTVLSLLAVEYPAHRLACYVSDDGASPVTYYSLVEASKFAQIWVPFCKTNDVQVRAPFVYFSTEPEALSSGFMEDWRYLKNEYEELCRKIEGASMNYFPPHMKEELEDFSNIQRGNHASIVKVIWENKGGSKDGVPHLVYITREKRPKHAHCFKAGAMNVLTRVSGVMTNAPIMLNMDCDMFVNNPKVVLHAMCLLLGSENDSNSAFVQCPQHFYGGLKDDPFGNQLEVLQQKVGVGIAGIQGPFYAGTGCFHRRKVIYGSSPDSGDNTGHGNLTVEKLHMIYGTCKELIESAVEIRAGKPRGEQDMNIGLSSRVEVAKMVAGYAYEFNTSWGKEIGWSYGSLAEDMMTGLRIHSMGWRSVYLDLSPAAFLGDAPTGGPASMTQYKRWATGLLEILFSGNSPLVAMFTKKLMFRQGLAYLFLLVWALRSIFELCYAMLPTYCLLTNTSFLPKASEWGMVVVATLFVVYNLFLLIEYLECGLSVRAWWNNQRMQRIVALTAWLFGFLAVLLKLLGLSQTIFEVTKKDQPTAASASSAAKPGRFTFDSSPVFVSGTALVILHLAAVGVSVGRQLLVVPTDGDGAMGPGVGEYVCSVWTLVSFWPFFRGLFEKGSYGIPWPTICKAVLLASIFVQVVFFSVH